ncbi:hypothetical protein VPH35_064023 [Triticum aestivum]
MVVAKLFSAPRFGGYLRNYFASRQLTRGRVVSGVHETSPNLLQQYFRASNRRRNQTISVSRARDATAMALGTTEPLLLQPPEQRRRPPDWLAWGLPAAVLTLLLLSASGPLRPPLFRVPPPETVPLTLLAGAQEKGAVCLDGTPPGYHLQRGSGDGSNRWLIHLEGGGWCSTIKDCSNRRMYALGSSNFMKPMRFAGAGILGSDQLQNPDFYNWNKVFVRYCDGASFSGDAEGRAQALLTGCSAGGLATILHCDDFSARFSRDVSVKCLADAGFFLDVKDISGKRSFWSVYDGVVHLQNVREVLPKDCLANKEPTEIRNVLVPVSSAPDKPWSSCKDNIRNCNSTQIKVLDAFRNTMVGAFKVVEDKEDWGLFIDSCFTHCQSLYGISWNSEISPRLGNKSIAEAAGDWYHGRSQGEKEIDCEYPCNPTCSGQLPP